MPTPNPRAGGGSVCAVDPENNVAESSEGNNACTDTVSVAVPDLTVAKTNSVSGSAASRLAVDLDLDGLELERGRHRASRVSTCADVMVRDNLPNANIGYGPPTSPTRTGIH